MVTAGRREDDAGLPAYRVVQNDIRRDVAGVKRDHHVGTKGRLELVYVAGDESEPGEALTLCHRIAVIYDIFLQVDAAHINLSGAYRREIIIHSESEVALAAAEVVDDDRSVGREAVFNIADDLEKPVYLAELRLFLVVYAAVFVGEPEVGQKAGVFGRGVCMV